MRHLFVVESLDKHVRKEKEFILTLQEGSSAGVGGVCICVESINLTFRLACPDSIDGEVV